GQGNRGCAPSNTTTTIRLSTTWSDRCGVCRFRSLWSRAWCLRPDLCSNIASSGKPNRSSASLSHERRLSLQNPAVKSELRKKYTSYNELLGTKFEEELFTTLKVHRARPQEWPPAPAPCALFAAVRGADPSTNI